MGESFLKYESTSSYIVDEEGLPLSYVAVVVAKYLPRAIFHRQTMILQIVGARQAQAPTILVPFSSLEEALQPPPSFSLLLVTCRAEK